MADETGSDLDVFEGLTKKKPEPSSPPAASPTIRGGVTPSRPLPPPSKKGGALPKPKPPPSKRPSSAPSSGDQAAVATVISGSGIPGSGIPGSGVSGLPKPKAPPSKRSASSSFPPQRDSDAPVLSIKPASVSAMFDGPASTDGGSILPGTAVADLDWDDEEESTSVFDRSASDLFGDLAGRKLNEVAPAPKASFGGAAALLASSGRPAASIPGGVSNSPPVTQPMPKIPAPAPVPRDISEAARRDAHANAVDARGGSHPSWAPSQPPAGPATSPPQKRGASTILLAAIAVLVLGVAAFLYLRSSSAASVMVTVTHQGKSVEAANIYVDGQKKCEFAPCKLELKPGPKNVRVVSGNLAGTQTINVEGGKDITVAIALGVAPDTGPAPSESAPVEDKPASITLASAMKDKKAEVKVFINGEDKGKLPLELKDLKPGKYVIKLEGGDKYGNVEKTIELKSGENLELKDLKLPLLKVKVTFDLKTRGAAIKLVKEDDKGKKTETALAFRANKALKTLDTTFKWSLIGSLKGYDDLDKTLDFDGADEKMTVAVELQKESAEPPPTAAGPGPQSTGPTGPPPAKGDSGFINANSIPPSKVIINGRPHGSTPVTGVKVKPGSHTVIFKHKEFGTKSRTVTVAAGQTKTATVRFKKTSSGDDGGKKKKKKKSD
jgi:hypothetical protein